MSPDGGKAGSITPIPQSYHLFDVRKLPDMTNGARTQQQVRHRTRDMSPQQYSMLPAPETRRRTRQMHQSQDRTVTVTSHAPDARGLDLWQGTGPQTSWLPHCRRRDTGRSRRLAASRARRTALQARTLWTCRAPAGQAQTERSRSRHPTRSAWSPGGEPVQHTPGRHRSPSVCRA